MSAQTGSSESPVLVPSAALRLAQPAVFPSTGGAKQGQQPVDVG